MLDGFKDMFMSGENPSGEAQGGLGGFLQDAAAGMGNIRSTAAPGAAFGQGFSSAMSSSAARRSAAAKEREAAADKAYARKKDAIDLGFKSSAERRAEETQKTTQQKARLDIAKATKDVMNDASGDLTHDEMFKLEGAVKDHMNSLKTKSELPNTPEEQQQINESLIQEGNRFRDEFEKKLKGERLAPAAPPSGAETPTPGPNPAPATPGGDGKTKDKPMVFKPGDDAVAMLRNAPLGTYYINPVNGALLRKNKEM